VYIYIYIYLLTGLYRDFVAVKMVKVDIRIKDSTIVLPAEETPKKKHMELKSGPLGANCTRPNSILLQAS
jgi:hypothetical protein